MHIHLKKIISGLLLMLGCSGLAVAGISLSTTRVVFPGDTKEVTLTVYAGKTDVVFQSWVDIDENPEQDIPFTVLPALARLDPDQAQILRVLYQGEALPADRESLFWLNVQEIPKIPSAMAEGKVSGLSFTVRQRIKMFFRPVQVNSEPIAMTEKMNFQLLSSKKGLSIENTGPNFITLVGIATEPSVKNPVTLVESVMVPPFSSKQVEFDTTLSGSEGLTFSSIDDLGFTRKFSVNLKPGTAFSPVRVNEAGD